MSIIGGLMGKNTVSGVAEAFNAVDITTDPMKQAISDWYNLYYDKKATEDSDPGQQVPYTIVRKITKACFSEYDPTTKDEFAKAILEKMNQKQIYKKALDKALIGGICGIKPIPRADGFSFSLIDRPNILVFARNQDGEMTDIGMCETSTFGKKYYTLLERRTLDGNGYLTITNKLYVSDSSGELGRQTNLQALPRYEELAEEYTFKEPVNSLGIAWLEAPIENCVDGSADCVSIYAAAAGEIHNININEAQLNGEFERGQSRIITSSDMLKNNRLKDKVFVGIDDDIESTGITIFSPALRDASFFARKQEYLRTCESIIGLKRGLLSDVEAVERTATEVTSSEGDYNLTIIDFQEAWETALRELMRLCGIFGKLYKVQGAHEIEEDQVIVDWGNGVLYDREAKNNELFTQVSAGMLKPERYLGWYYDLPHETESDIAKIRKDYMPELEKLMEE